MNVIVVGVEEVTVTHHEVNYRILPLPSTLRDELGQVSWVAAKHIKDLPPVVVAARDLTIRVVVLFPPGPGKPLDLVALGIFDQAKIWISVSPGPFEMNREFL